MPLKLFCVKMRTVGGVAGDEYTDSKPLAKAMRNNLNLLWAGNGKDRDIKKGPYYVARGPDHHKGRY